MFCTRLWLTATQHWVLMKLREVYVKFVCGGVYLVMLDFCCNARMTKLCQQTHFLTPYISGSFDVYA